VNRIGSLAALPPILAQGVAWPYVVQIYNNHTQELILALVVASALFRLSAWTRLEEHNWFDIVMRGLPFEDLSPRGQVAVIFSWALGAGACALIFLHCVVPRLPR